MNDWKALTAFLAALTFLFVLTVVAVAAAMH